MKWKTKHKLLFKQLFSFTNWQLLRLLQNVILFSQRFVLGFHTKTKELMRVICLVLPPVFLMQIWAHSLWKM